jgi:hypothetical protein
MRSTVSAKPSAMSAFSSPVGTGLKEFLAVFAYLARIEISARIFLKREVVTSLCNIRNSDSEVSSEKVHKSSESKEHQPILKLSAHLILKCDQFCEDHILRYLSRLQNILALTINKIPCSSLWLHCIFILWLHKLPKLPCTQHLSKVRY